MKKYAKKYMLFLLFIVSIVSIDQITKYYIIKTFHLYQSVPVINGFFSITHIRNKGVAFGLFSNNHGQFMILFFKIITALAMIVIVYIFHSLRDDDRYAIIGLSMIMGGAMSNFIDRIRYNEVTDFLDIYLGTYHWPAFNIADSFITIGMVFIILSFFLNTHVSSTH